MKFRVVRVAADVIDGKIRCEIFVEPNEVAGLQYAFYINKNGSRIHTEWYSDRSVFEYEIGSSPGYYQVQGFARIFGQEVTESAKSNPLFVNATKVDGRQRLSQDSVAAVCLLEGECWKFPAIFYPGPGDYLFVLLPSATDRSKYSLPAFSRWTWAAQGIFPGKALCVADPTLELSDELKLSWILGDKKIMPRKSWR